MAMGDLARPDEYTVEDNPWARGVRAAQDYAARETPDPQPNVMGSLLGMGRAGETIGERATQLGQHAADYFMTPGRVVGGLENRYPPGSEEADYIDRANQAAANQYAIGTGFGMVFDPGLYFARGSIGAGAGGRVVQPEIKGTPTRITMPVGGRLPEAANANVSQAEVIANLPPPLGPTERIWRNYVKHMSADEMLQSEPVWSTAANLSEAKGISPSEAFAEVVNDMYGRMGANRYMTPQQAKLEMARQRGIISSVPAESRAQIAVPVGGRLSDLAKRDRYKNED